MIETDSLLAHQVAYVALLHADVKVHLLNHHSKEQAAVEAVAVLAQTITVPAIAHQVVCAASLPVDAKGHPCHSLAHHKGRDSAAAGVVAALGQTTTPTIDRQLVSAASPHADAKAQQHSPAPKTGHLLLVEAEVL